MRHLELYVPVMGERVLKTIHRADVYDWRDEPRLTGREPHQGEIAWRYKLLLRATLRLWGMVVRLEKEVRRLRGGRGGGEKRLAA